MAFYIETKQGNRKTWHLQNKRPEVLWHISDDVQKLQADGDELELIRQRLVNVPITHGGVCIWRGEMARFIYDNLSPA